MTLVTMLVFAIFLKGGLVLNATTIVSSEKACEELAPYLSDFERKETQLKGYDVDHVSHICVQLE
jgi:hypothetical protein